MVDLGAPLRDFVNRSVDWIVSHHGDGFDRLSRTLVMPINMLERLLVAVPAEAGPVIVAALAFAISRQWRFAALMGALTASIALLSLWQPAMQTLALMTVAVGLAFIIGVPLGIAGAKLPRFGRVTRPIYDLMQTIPSFVYLIPAAMLLGLGKVPALIATVTYALPPLARLTDHGLRHVDPAAIDAARALGLRRGPILWLIELPLAWPTVLQGLNQAIMMALGMVVVASMIGARGLGEIVLLGLQRSDAGRGLVGGLGIVLLAVILDRMTQRWLAHGRPTGNGRQPASP